MSSALVVVRPLLGGMLVLFALVTAIACAGDESDDARSEASTSATAATATPTGDELTADESTWLGMASVVGAGAVSEALNAIARDREDAGAFFAASTADDGSIAGAVPEDAPGRFAAPHAALLAAREDLAAFRTEGKSRADTGTEYDALLAAYEEAVIGWAAVVGVDVP